jgi:hypothetical protein
VRTIVGVGAGLDEVGDGLGKVVVVAVGVASDAGV